MSDSIKHICFDFSGTLYRGGWSLAKVADNAADKEVTKTIRELKGILQLSIFSNLTRERIVELLSELELSKENFAHILGSNNVPEMKPAVEGFHAVIERIGLPPKHILYIGDTLENDVLPAKQAGLQTGIVYQESEEADYSFRTFGDILKLFR